MSRSSASRCNRSQHRLSLEGRSRSNGQRKGQTEVLAAAGQRRLIIEERVGEHRDLVEDRLVGRVEAVMGDEHVGVLQRRPLIDVALGTHVGMSEPGTLGVVEAVVSQADHHLHVEIREDVGENGQGRPCGGLEIAPDHRAEGHQDPQLRAVSAKRSIERARLPLLRRERTEERERLEGSSIVLVQKGRRLAVHVQEGTQALDIGEGAGIGHVVHVAEASNRLPALGRRGDSGVLAKRRNHAGRLGSVPRADVDIGDTEATPDQRRDHGEGVVDDQRRREGSDLLDHGFGVDPREADVPAGDWRGAGVGRLERESREEIEEAPARKLDVGAEAAIGHHVHRLTTGGQTRDHGQQALQVTALGHAHDDDAGVRHGQRSSKAALGSSAKRRSSPSGPARRSGAWCRRIRALHRRHHDLPERQRAGVDPSGRSVGAEKPSPGAFRHRPAGEGATQIESSRVDREPLVVDDAQMPASVDQHVLGTEVPVNAGKPSGFGIPAMELGIEPRDLAEPELPTFAEDLELRPGAFAPLQRTDRRGRCRDFDRVKPPEQRPGLLGPRLRIELGEGNTLDPCLEEHPTVAGPSQARTPLPGRREARTGGWPLRRSRAVSP